MNCRTVLLLASLLTTSFLRAEVPSLLAENLGAPVKTARANVSTLVENSRGEWRWIGQFMNYAGTTDFKYVRKKVEGTGRVYVAFEDPELRPDAEWIIADLAGNKVKTLGLPGFHGRLGIRAENGRVFYPVDFMQMWYYDPVEDALKILGELSEWKPFFNDRCLYQFRLGKDGCLYGTTQGYSGKTAVVRINPDTLEWKVFTDIGANRPASLTYGYTLALDLPWVYVAVGQGDWELVALNVDTGEKRLLAERKGDGSRIEVAEKDFVTAGLTEKGGGKRVWCVEGKLSETQPPDSARLANNAYPHIPWKLTKPIPEGTPPELDPQGLGEMDPSGLSHVRWRPAGAQEDFKTVSFHVKSAAAQKIVSMAELPDGDVFGSVVQYNGFFRYHTKVSKFEYFGKAGPSSPLITVAEGKAWYIGYPNVGLYVYDPDQPWKAPQKANAGNPGDNPRLVGYFGQGVTEAHHSKGILLGPNGRLYLLGHRERWSTGTGLGYYELATGKKFGLGSDMKDVDPQGFALLPKAGRVVVSGRVHSETKGAPVGTAQLRVYDLDLKEVERLTVKEGLPATGFLTAIGRDPALLGRIDGEAKDALYLYDLEKKAVVKWADVDGVLQENAFQRPSDGTWWIIKDSSLCRLNVETLELTPVGKLPKALHPVLWVGNDLYGAADGEVFRVKVEGR
ncbi:MAG: hypothetical protein IT578_01695 [Verrucomicrobiae bacterium]|nr:hypothetical protein [Verrucomicrobiae bacterium]